MTAMAFGLGKPSLGQQAITLTSYDDLITAKSMKLDENLSRFSRKRYRLWLQENAKKASGHISIL